MAERRKRGRETSAPDHGGSGSDKDYEVGYGRPPLSTRFKPGYSGNPKGRPKGAKNLRTIASEKLEVKVSIREAGREKRMSKGEIGVTKLINRFAETGDPKLLTTILKLLEGGTSGQATDLQSSGDHRDRAASDEAVLQWFLEANGFRGENDK